MVRKILLICIFFSLIPLIAQGTSDTARCYDTAGTSWKALTSNPCRAHGDTVIATASGILDTGIACVEDTGMSRTFRVGVYKYSNNAFIDSSIWITVTPSVGTKQIIKFPMVNGKNIQKDTIYRICVQADSSTKRGGFLAYKSGSGAASFFDMMLAVAWPVTWSETGTGSGMYRVGMHYHQPPPSTGPSQFRSEIGNAPIRSGLGGATMRSKI
jgi:hypothetical protein